MKNLYLAIATFFLATTLAQAGVTYKTLDVDQVATLLQGQNNKVAVFDANTDKARREIARFGVQLRRRENFARR
jgi:uncharacterized membrane protein (DUF441 family)